MQVLEEIKVSVYENVYSKKPKIMRSVEGAGRSEAGELAF